MTFKKSGITLVFCLLSGLAVAAASQGGSTESGKTVGAVPAPMPAAM